VVLLTTAHIMFKIHLDQTVIECETKVKESPTDKREGKKMSGLKINVEPRIILKALGCTKVVKTPTSIVYVHFRCTMDGPDSSYSCFVTHISSKVDREAKIDPPIQTEYLRSGGATILMVMD
jgi:hypothetical protein